MENLENNMREVVTPDSEKFDEKGNVRTQRQMLDGTIAFLSDEEYTQEIESQRD